ncbi:SpaH/EbpB family LPXTG-anchored major pilin [Lactococcus petauri]|uniref:SpaH/EbpB family LPXTG-anchored major pilin n=1 Tax=Lactococcus petauri TaxID=1940789 RepID=UPI002551A5FC|nr:SpaH/EbpB family LPXTG-anchored major pilin [Lactococcus petauri]
MEKINTKKAVLSRILTASALLMLTTGPAVSTVTSVINASADTHQSIADDNSKRSITITKYQATSLNDHGAEGDGTSKPVTNAPLQGVKFKLQRVLPKAGGVQLVDPTQQKEGVDYTIDTTFTEQTGTTDANGQIKWDLGTGKTNDGIYLVTEVDSSGAVDPATNKPVTVTTPANPFFVYVPQTNRGDNSSLIYDVQAQPKNVVGNDLNPSKTINGKPGDSVVAGNTFQWELTTGIPSGLYETAKENTTIPVVDDKGNQLYTDTAGQHAAYITVQKGQPLYFDGTGGPYYDAKGQQVTPPAQSNFSMTDQLNDKLTYKNATVWVHKPTGEWIQLDSSDYTVNYSAGNHSFTMNLTSKGIKEVGSGSVTNAQGATVTGPFDKISTHIETTVNEGFNGNVPNTFEVKYQTPGTKPGTDTPSEKPQYYNGGFDIKKQDSKTAASLSGAEFKIATSEENARAGKFLATDGKSYTSATIPSGVTFLTATSGNDGRAEFNGLPLVWTDGNADNVVNIGPNGLPTNGDRIQQDYWVVETKAPSGYELLKNPQQVTVDLSTHDNKTIELTVNDDKSTKLPFTGGAGTGILITVALGTIGIGTAFIVMDKKRKAEEA